MYLGKRIGHLVEPVRWQETDAMLGGVFDDLGIRPSHQLERLPVGDDDEHVPHRDIAAAAVFAPPDVLDVRAQRVT